MKKFYTKISLIIITILFFTYAVFSQCNPKTVAFPAQSPDNDIVSFSLPQQTGVTTINTTAHIITLQVVSGTALTALVPTITVSLLATVNPSSAVAQNFTAPFTYTVTAEDGTVQAWVVTVTVAVQVQSSEKDILTFSIPGQNSGSTVINTVNHTVTLVVPAGTAVTALVPYITVSPLATINPLSGVVRDFSAPIHYIVTAENGSTRDWTVTVNVQVLCLNAPVTTIGSFVASAGTQISVPVTVSCFNSIGAITLRIYYDPSQLIYALPTNMNPDLAANMTAENNPVNPTSAYIAVEWTDINGATISDGSLMLNVNFTLVSGPATISFDNTIASGSQCEYMNVVGDVLIDMPTATYYHNGTITQFVSNENDIISFTLPEQVGATVINAINNTISVEVPLGTSLTALVPTITVSDFATISPASGVAQNFTAPFTYTVTAENGSVQSWIVNISVVMSSAKDILTFTIQGQTGAATINTTNHTVTMQISYGMSLVSLTPTITVSSFATINPLSGIARNFTAPVTYTVTAQNGTTQAWIVTITALAPSSAKNILNFSFPSQTVPAIISTIDHTVTIPLPAGTALTTLIPTITISPYATINPASGVTQNFTSPVIYTVTAQDGTTQTWIITVLVPTGNAPITTVGNKFSAVAASVVTLPVTVTNFVDIGSMTLRFDYNPTVVTYLPATNMNAALAELIVGSPTIVDATHAFLSATWTSGTAVTLANNSKLFNVNFTFISGTTSIAFDNNNASMYTCEYADVNGNVLNDSPTSTYYINGLVTLSAPQKNILTFILPQQTAAGATINTANHTVAIQVMGGTLLTALVPTITVSAGATINPVSLVPQDFTAPFTYIVTANDGTTQTWIVTVNTTPNHLIYGVVKYNNTANTSLTSIVLKLMNGTTQIATATSDASGNFLLTNITDGSYTIDAITTKPWGGVTSTDVLKLRRHIAGLELLTEPIRLSAADANNSVTLTSTDVLKMQRRIAGLDNSFTRGDWVFEKPVSGGKTIVVSGADISQNFYGLCVGDVNGSNNPVLAKQIYNLVSLQNEGIVNIRENQEFEIHVTVSNQMEIGSFQLFFNFNSDIFNVSNVSLSNQSEDLIFNVQDGMIKIVWSGLSPIFLNKNETLLTINLKTKSIISNATGIVLSDANEFSDASGNIFENVELLMPTLVYNGANIVDLNSSDNYRFNIYPNPVKNDLTIETNFATKQKCEILNILGEVVYTFTVNKSATFNTSLLNSGVYFVKVYTDKLPMIKRFIKD